MKIIGNGMMAKSAMKFVDDFPNVVIFASGVGDSTCKDVSSYERECKLLYETLRGCKSDGSRIVYFSSGGAVYGDGDTIRTESMALYPQTMYGRHKLFCEAVIEKSGVDYLILRISNVVGSDANKKQLFPVLENFAKQGKATIHRDAWRDLIDVEDVGRILNDLLGGARESLVLNVASGHSVPVSRIFEEIQLAMGMHARVELIPGGEMQQFSIDCMRNVLSSDIEFGPDYHVKLVQKYLR